MLDLKILASHPVQYQAPWFRAMVAEGLDIEVGYYYPGAAGQVAYDVEFGIEFAWDLDLLDGYPHRCFVGGRAGFGLAEQARAAPKVLAWALRDQETPLLLIGWFTRVVWLVWLLRILTRSPTFVFGDNTPASFAEMPKAAWRHSLLRWLLHRTSAILFVGRHNRLFWTQLGVPNARLFYTPHSIDQVRFANEATCLLPQRRVLCREYGLDPDLPTFLFCGKLIPIKRPLQLLDAFLDAGLRDRAQLLYVGDGHLRAELERRIQGLGIDHQVHLLGFLNQSQMPLAYVLGEILCLVSERETWGLVVNEALACGRPVIVTETVGCAPDLVGPENGWVVPVLDHLALTQALLEAYESRFKWPAMGCTGQRRAAGNTYSAMAGGVRLALGAVY